ncbi:MAG TPA: ATP-binding protein [Longimicrobium sp.]|uniref:AAA family ATPase n=1 Tax=Longimicrobium sp. TaxID=2029185 RepID=UPI002ED81250
MSEPFASVPHDARGHLGLVFYEAVLGVVAYASARAAASGQDPAAPLAEHPFLEGYLAELAPHLDPDAPWDQAVAGVGALRAAWEAAAEGAWLPLLALRDAARGIGDEHVLALVMAGLIEEDARFGDVFEAAQAPGGGRRPAVALVHEVVRITRPGLSGDGWTLCRPLLEAGLVEIANPDAPRAAWQMRVPAALWTALRGETPSEPLPGVRHYPAGSFMPLSGMVLDGEVRARLVELTVLLAAGEARVVVVRGLPGSERLEVLGAVAGALGRGILEARPDAGAGTDVSRVLGPLATLTHAVPVFAPDLGPGETFDTPDWRGYSGPLGVVAGHDGGVGGTAAENALTLNLPPDPPALRLLHWERALPLAGGAQREHLARSLTLGGRYIRRTAELARGYAALDRRPAVTPDDVRAAARAINRQQLDTLAQRLGDGGGWDRLVLHASTLDELGHLERRCRHRERLLEALSDGFPGGLNRGVRALFQGPSGTGKTLAARVLASALGLDVYRVDLASIVNKYIGETEKNLSRVLGRAEDLDVVLLLDEGDSLMGKRTEVKSANDRWANLETNYLLQRLDTYSGILIVTTNAPGSIDSAFQRRMDAVVSFHVPDVEERVHLWHLHLPPDHLVPFEAVEDAAARYELAGGQIRNAAVHAGLLALGRPDGRLREADLRAAIEAEYRKAGASFPRLRGEPADRGGAMAAFLGAIR